MSCHNQSTPVSKSLLLSLFPKHKQQALALFLASSLLVLSGCSEQNSTAKGFKVPQTSKLSIGAINPGERLYVTCLGCHGVKGDGGIGPRINNQTKEELVTKLNLYKSGQSRGVNARLMTSMAEVLSDQGIDQVAEFITTLKE
jgi:cytochrome c553